MDTLWYAFGMGTHYGMGTYCMCTLGMGTLPNGYRKHNHFVWTMDTLGII